MGRPPSSSLLTSRAWQFTRAQRPLIMGVINLTPDSFSDGGLIRTPQQAFNRARELAAAGADFLDVGAESTRPGASPLSIPEELSRLLPSLKKIVTLSVPVSVDTYKPEVARAALQAGAQLINDITGLRDRAMCDLVASAKVPVVVMHMRGTPQNMQRAPRYTRVVEDVRAELLQAAGRAERMGVARRQIILDPGIGFGKTLRHNLELLGNLRRLVATGYPILVGPSRKSFIAGILGARPPQERVWGTAAAISLAVAQGVRILRVHDVAEMKMVSEVAAAICRGKVISTGREN